MTIPDRIERVRRRQALYRIVAEAFADLATWYDPVVADLEARAVGTEAAAVSLVRDAGTLPLPLVTVEAPLVTPAEVEAIVAVERRASPVRTPRASSKAEAPSARAVEAAYQLATSAEALCRIRDRAGWKQQDVADALGVPRATLYRAELYGRGLHTGDMYRRAWERVEARLVGLRGEVAA